MPAPNNRFVPQVCDLESRVVPDASSALDADFFDKIHLAQDQAVQQYNDRVRVITGIYQDETKGATDQYNADEQQVNQLTADQAAQINALIQQDAQYRKALQDRLNALQKQNKDEDAAAQDATKTQIDNLRNNPPPGATPEAVQAQINLMLSNYQKFAQQITADITSQAQQVLDQFAGLQQSEVAQYSSLIASTQANVAAIKAAEQRLLSIYVTDSADLVNQFYGDVRNIQAQLQAQITQLQNAYVTLKNQLLIQQQQNLMLQQLDSIAPPPVDPDNDGDDDTGIAY